MNHNRRMQSGHRTVALQVRSHRLAYAAFETSTILLDVGIRRWRSVRKGGHCFESLIAALRPSAIVLSRTVPRTRRNRDDIPTLIALIQQLASESSIPVAVVDIDRIRRCFLKAHGVSTRQKTASLLTERYPELTMRLPPPRRAWEPERWNMAMFDAVALGMFYLSCDQQIISSEPDQNSKPSLL